MNTKKPAFENLIQFLFMVVGVGVLAAAYAVYAIFTLFYSIYQNLFGKDQ